MKSLRYARLARDDLDEIYYFIAKQNVTAADHFLSLLKDKAHWLKSHSELGAVESRYGRDLRVTSVGNYVIYYRTTQAVVEVVRVLHGPRDHGPLLEE